MVEGSAIINFLGRFHPLVVHLPIGFLSLAILLEIISRRTGATSYNVVLRFVWFLSGLAASLAVVLGFFLSQEGGYDDETLFIHQWSGITLVAMSLSCYLLRKDNLFAKPAIKRIYFPFVVLISLVLVVTGHMGGSLTHGPEYLVEYAPGPIQRMLGMTTIEVEARPKVNSLDSADIFKDAIGPILNSKCITCHNSSKRKGKLVLTSYADMMKGGEEGPVIKAGSLASSEIYRRITLPRDHKEFMPSEGKRPLTEEQLKIIKWWIENNAPQSGMITSLKPDDGTVELFEQYFDLGINREQEVSALPPDTAALRNLVTMGFTVRRLSATSNLVEVGYSGNLSDTSKMKPLLSLKDQLVWLQLSNTGISDDALKIVGQLSNLQKLNLSKNRLSDQGVKYLFGLANLKYLNLYETNVTDGILDSLVALPALHELYVWQTSVTGEYVEKLKTAYPGLRIIYNTK